MKGHTDSTEQLAAAEPLDALLADYFAWIDQGHPPDVEAFLAARNGAADRPELVAQLRHYVESTRSVEALASSTLAAWIDPLPPWQGEDRAGQPATPLGEGEPKELGDYELLEEIGRGGMGIVYKARHRGLGRIVCIKRVLLGRLAGAGERRRFRIEAQAMARLRHPNLVTVYEVGRLDEQDYFSMEYLAGPTLAERAGAGPLAAAEAARYLHAVARAIHYAHENGLLHRDLKPSNVLIDEFDQPRVTDFGLARSIEAGSLTRTGIILGTPSYMAPEQTHGDPAAVDVRSDVYGLGAILYELITGRPPFQGETALDTLLQVRRAEPVAPTLLNPRAARDLETICLTCLDKEPDRRYRSAAALADDLQRFLKHEPVHARPLGAAERLDRWCRRHPLQFILVATVVAALLVVAGTAALAYRATTAALADAEEARDEQAQLVGELRRERDAVANHLYLSQIDRARQAIDRGDLRDAAELLQRQIPAGDDPDRRGWEWHYLQALLGQEERSWEAHAGSVQRVAWSPDGRRVASVGEDQMLCLWDGASGERLQEFPDLSGMPLDLAWHPGGERLATVTHEGTLQIWDLERGSLVRQLRGSTVDSTPRCLSWSTDGDRLAVGGDRGEILIWTPEAGSPPIVWPGHSERVNAVQWAGRGDWIASASDDGTVRIWRGDGTAAAVLRGHGGWINAVAFSADARRLAAVSEEGSLQVWSIEVDDEEAAELRVEEFYSRVTSERKALLSVIWSRDARRLLTGGVSPRLMMWDAERGEPMQLLRGHLHAVRSLAVQPQGQRVASASADGTVKIWTMDRRPDGAPLYRGDSPIRTVAWSGLGDWFAWRDIDGSVEVWDADEGRPALEFSELPIGATGLAWHPHAPQIALSRNDTVGIFTLPDGRQRLRLEGHQGPIWTIAWDPSGRRIATGSNDRSVIVWESSRGEILQRFDQHPGDVRSLAWSHSGDQLATVSADATIHIWDAATGSLRRVIEASAAPINDLAWRGDDRQLAAALHDGSVVRWDLNTGAALPPLRGHRHAVWRVIWSGDGMRLFSCGQDGTIRLWDAATGQEVLQIAVHDQAVWSISLAADGRLLSSGIDQTVRLFAMPAK